MYWCSYLQRRKKLPSQRKNVRQREGLRRRDDTSMYSRKISEGKRKYAAKTVNR